MRAILLLPSCEAMLLVSHSRGKGTVSAPFLILPYFGGHLLKVSIEPVEVTSGWAPLGRAQRRSPGESAAPSGPTRSCTASLARSRWAATSTARPRCWSARAVARPDSVSLRRNLA